MSIGVATIHSSMSFTFHLAAMRSDSRPLDTSIQSARSSTSSPLAQGVGKNRFAVSPIPMLSSSRIPLFYLPIHYAQIVTYPLQLWQPAIWSSPAWLWPAATSTRRHSPSYPSPSAANVLTNHIDAIPISAGSAAASTAQPRLFPRLFSRLVLLLRR